MIGKIEREGIEGNSQKAKLSITLVYVLEPSTSIFDINTQMRKDTDALEDHIRNLLR